MRRPNSEIIKSELYQAGHLGTAVFVSFEPPSGIILTVCRMARERLGEGN